MLLTYINHLPQIMAEVENAEEKKVGKTKSELYQELLLKSQNQHFTSIQQLTYEQIEDRTILENLAVERLIDDPESYDDHTSVLYKFGISLFDIQNGKPGIQEWLCICTTYLDNFTRKYDDALFQKSLNNMKTSKGCTQRYCTPPEKSIGYWCDRCYDDRIKNMKRLFIDKIKLSNFREHCVLYISKIKFTSLDSSDKEKLLSCQQIVKEYHSTIRSADSEIEQLEVLVESLTNKKQARDKLLFSLDFTREEITSALVIVAEQIENIRKKERVKELRIKLCELKTLISALEGDSFIE